MPIYENAKPCHEKGEKRGEALESPCPVSKGGRGGGTVSPDAPYLRDDQRLGTPRGEKIGFLSSLSLSFPFTHSLSAPFARDRVLMKYPVCEIDSNEMERRDRSARRSAFGVSFPLGEPGKPQRLVHTRACFCRAQNPTVINLPPLPPPEGGRGSCARPSSARDGMTDNLSRSALRHTRKAATWRRDLESRCVPLGAEKSVHRRSLIPRFSLSLSLLASYRCENLITVNSRAKLRGRCEKSI